MTDITKERVNRLIWIVQRLNNGESRDDLIAILRDYQERLDAKAGAMAEDEPIQIVFDGPPEHIAGRFVEVEQGGKGIDFGEWKHREDGYWVLELPNIAGLVAELEQARPEVRAFAKLMEVELRKHDDRPGWKGEDPFWLLQRLREEAGELERGLYDHSITVGQEAADVANFAMMIADVSGGLDEQEKAGGRNDCATGGGDAKATPGGPMTPPTDASPGPITAEDERREGHKALRYDKATRTIKTFDPNPPGSSDDERAFLWLENECQDCPKCLEFIVSLRRRLAGTEVTREQFESALEVYRVPNYNGAYVKEEDIQRFLYRLGIEVVESENV